MRKVKEHFHKKQGIFRRVFSLILVLAMIMTMIPSIGGNLNVKAASTPMNVTIHFMKPSNWNWAEPAVQFWGNSEGLLYVSNDANPVEPKEIKGWGVNGYSFSEGTTNANGDKDYYLTVKTDATGFQFLDFQNTENTKNPANDAKLTQYTGDAPTDVYYITKDGGKSFEYYLDAEGNTSVPDLPETETTFLLVGTLPGTGWEASATPNFVKSETNENEYSISLKNVPAKTYEYKILEDAALNGWNKAWAQGAGGGNVQLEVKAPADITMKLDKTDADKKTDVTISYIKTLDVETPAQVEKGVDSALPATGTYYAGDEQGSKTEGVDVTYTAVSEGITVSDTTLKVPTSYKGTDVTIRAAYSDVTKDITIPVVDKVYTYTIYYHDFSASHMATDASSMWIWEDGGAGGVLYNFSGTEQLSDGNTWLKATVKLPYYKNIRIIPKNYGDTWSWQNDTISYDNTAKDENVTLYITSNSKEAYTSIPELVKPRERYVMVEYDRPDGDYDGWNIFTWNSGFGDKVTINLQEMNGKMVAKIPVKDTTADMMLSFCMRRSTADDEWADKDGGDHYVSVSANQNVVKAKFVQGEGITEVLPSNVGCELDGENGQIHFYYRDDEMVAAENTQKSIADKVSVTINGEKHEMTYDAANERFSYDLTDITTGDYCYYYTVDGEEKLDAYNAETKDYDGKTCSYRFYKKFDAAITAELSQSSMDYNDNNVLTIKTNPAEGADMSGFEVATATVDLSALGLSSTYAIDPELMEATISCLDTTTTGDKTLPVTVKDIYGNVYRTSTNVAVTERDKKDGDFDWDEAVIYFAVTDRFFDGDTSNNDAYEVGDYDTSDKGGSSYHGGDFDGLNEKLDYLKDLGVNTIWITPIVENITDDQHDAKTDMDTYGYHGYWASDFKKLNKHLGTEEEFAALIEAAHSRGMKLMVDVVLNHAGYDTENYFNSILKDKDGNAIKMLRDSSNTVSGDDKLAPLSDLPDFVTEDAEVRDQLIEWQTDWMDKFDIDYYRVDTVKHVDSTTWSAFKNSLTKVNPDFKMIGEYAGAGYANTAGELGTGSMDALLDFDFNDFAQNFVGGKISTVENSLLKRNGALNNTATMGNFLNSHDEDSLQYKLVNESRFSEEEAYNLMKVAATLQITAKGQPVIYYGDELGQAGANDWPYQTNRRDFDWTELEAQKTDSNSIYNHYKTMLSIRNAYTDVFARGSRTSILSSDEGGYDVIARSYGDTTLYVGMNIKEKATEVTIPVSAEAGSKMKNLYDGKEYTVSADKTVTVSIPAAKDGGTVVLNAVKTAIIPDGNNNNNNNSGNNDKENSGVNLNVTVADSDFTEVVDTINAVSDGTTVIVNVNGTTAIPEDVFNSMSGKDVNVVFKVGENATWVVKGKDIKNKLSKAIDLGVTLGKSDIPSDKIKALAGDNAFIELSLAHDGEFGFTAALRLYVGTQYNGKYANLYYYNEKTGSLEYIKAVKVNADGAVEYEFVHASDYVIVMSNADMKPADAASATPTANSTTPAANPTPADQNGSSVATGDKTPIAQTAAILIIGGCVLFVAYRRRKRV